MKIWTTYIAAMVVSLTLSACGAFENSEETGAVEAGTEEASVEGGEEEGDESTEDGGETSVEEGGETSTEEGGAVSEGEGSANESSCVEAFECFVNTAPEEQDDALFLCVPSELPEDALLSYVNLVHCVTENCPEDMGPNGAECWIEFCQENLDACYENSTEEG